MTLSASDWTAVLLTFKLALVSAFFLIIIAIPLALLLTRLPRFFKSIVVSLLTLPIVLPPTVLGFYLLSIMSPSGWLGTIATKMNIERLNFSFTGLVIASMVYSIPFAVQPIYQAFISINPAEKALARVMGLSPLKRLLLVSLPQAKMGVLIGFMMSFAHTLGEFGVVLMVGGNIEGISRVVSIQIYDHVESLQWQSAHQLSLFMLITSFMIILLMFLFSKTWGNTTKNAISF